MTSSTSGSQASAASRARADAEPRPAVVAPRVRLYSEPLLVDVGDGFITRFEEEDLPVVALSFEYRPGSQPDPAAEARARYLLESFGAVDLDCATGYEREIGSLADYLVHPEADVHALCTFGAYALPQLRALGWHIEVDPSYPVHVVDTTTPWYANVEPAPEDGQSDWFSLELGTEIAGQRVNLLPVLLELVEGSAASSLEGLATSSRRYVALPVGDNRYLPVPPEHLRVLLRVLLELYQGGGPQPVIRFPPLHGAALAHLDQAFDAAGVPLCWKGSEAARDRGFDLAAAPDGASIEPPGKLRAILRPYQRDGLAWLQHLRAHRVGGILADDMGLGKTLQTIAHLCAEKDAGRTDLPTLIISPTSLVGNWSRELKKFAPHLRVLVLHGAGRHASYRKVPISEVVLTSYPLLVRDLEALRDQPFHYVILDEAQTIKNPRSRSHRAAKELESRHRLCLSGTPIENNLDELWAQFDFLTPGLLGDELSFGSRFRTPIERGDQGSRLEALRERVSPFILRRMKDTVARDLPPKTEIVRPVEITGPQRELYESIRVSAHAHVRSAIRKKGFEASTVAILDALMKLRQVCCDPRLVSVASARNVEGSAKLELLFELLGRQLGHGRRVLVFSQFTSMLALIAHGLATREVPHVILTGSTVDRQAVIDEFESGAADVFLISLKAGGTGLNLTSADTVVHYDPWWNPAVQAQATDRAYRIGQKRPVFVYNLIVAGSVEERMLRLQDRKRWLADSILRAEGEAPATWSERDVDDLFAPLCDDPG
ncbi:MAG TPA: DEAD/DEAH box helicase [Kofleriaceae bacterium]|nr:DEAD/DEAH box helicase [Kofleriaceae bacterium]